MKLLPQAFPSLMGKLNLTTGGYGCVQRPTAVCDVPDVVQDQKALVVSHVNDGADLNCQVDGRGATNHGDVCSDVIIKNISPEHILRSTKHVIKLPKKSI